MIRMVAGRSVSGAPIILIVSTVSLLEEGGTVTADEGFIVTALFWGTVIRVVVLPSWLINPHSRKGMKGFSSETFERYTSKESSSEIFRTIISRHPSLRIDAGSYKLQGFFCPPMTQQPLASQEPLIIGTSRSHSDTPHSVGLLWTSGQPDAEISAWQQTTLARDIHAPNGIRNRNPSKRVAADPRLRTARPPVEICFVAYDCVP